MKDCLANLFSSIKNGQLAKCAFTHAPNKKICKTFLKVLWDEGFISGFKETADPKRLRVFLKYKETKPVVCALKMVSRPGRRLHYSIDKIQNFNNSKRLVVFSTSWGVRTGSYCKKAAVGGKVLSKIH